MTRSTSRNTEQFGKERKLTGLLRSKEDARKEIESRIEEGKHLLTRAVTTSTELRLAEAAENAWGEYNLELLRRLFDSDEFAESYARFYGMAFPINPTLNDHRRMFRERIEDKVSRLQGILAKLPLLHCVVPTSGAPDRRGSDVAEASKRVFVVHGHDDAAKQSVARFLERICLVPIILHEQPSSGKTIVEKLECYSDVGFAVVLLTPDDVGGERQKAGNAQQLHSRARQNVIAELGYFVGKLGRAKVSVLYKSGVELPSDFNGVVYIAMEADDSWHLKLAKELRAAGYQIDLNKL